jgi:hypothetical protein
MALPSVMAAMTLQPTPALENFSLTFRLRRVIE